MTRSTDSSAARLAALAEEFVASLGDLDSDRTLEMLAEPSQFVCRIRSSAIPLEKLMSGQEFCQRMKPMMRTLFPAGVRHVPRCVVAADGIAVVESECFGTSVRGREYNNHFAFIVYFDGEKVSKCVEYTDFLYVKEVIFDQ